MSSVQSPVSDMLVTVKSREIQRGTISAMAGQMAEARLHFLAAAHLELVLAQDYEEVGDSELSRRSLLSAASSLWRAEEKVESKRIFDELIQSDPGRAGEIQEIVNDLTAG